MLVAEPEIKLVVLVMVWKALVEKSAVEVALVVVALVVVELKMMRPVATFGVRETPSDEVAH